MRKILMAIVILVFVLPLSAYSVKALQKSTAHSIPSESPSAIIKKNQKAWKRSTANASIIHSDEFNHNRGNVGTSLDQLKNQNKVVIKGTVYKLEKMVSPKNTAYTKASIHVDQVISGDESVKNQTIYLALNGGLVSLDQYAGSSKPKNPDQKILVKNDEFPLPSVGSKVITGLLPMRVDESSEYGNALKQSGFTVDNSFAVNVPQYNFWVKAPKAKHYLLNNPKLRQKSQQDNDLAQALHRLTTELNQKYNDQKK